MWKSLSDEVKHLRILRLKDISMIPPDTVQPTPTDKYGFSEIMCVFSKTRFREHLTSNPPVPVTVKSL